MERRIVGMVVRMVFATGTVLLAAAPALSAEGEQTLYFGDLGQAITALVIFGLLVAILGRFAWKPLLTQIHRREQSMADALERSEKREQEATELLEQYRARMDRAEEQAEEVVSRGRRTVAEAREQVLSAAREEAARGMAAVREEIDHAKDAALREMYSSAADLAVDLAQRVIGKSLTDADHARILEQSLQEIRDCGGEGR